MVVRMIMTVVTIVPMMVGTAAFVDLLVRMLVWLIMAVLWRMRVLAARIRTVFENKHRCTVHQ
jgi:hypothetical protein